MSQTFERNLEALQARYPELAARMRVHVPSPDFQRVPTASGQIDLVVSRGGDPTPFYGVADPLGEAYAYWKTRELRNPALLLFLGLDLGYRLFAHLSRPNPNTRAYLLVERDPDIFYHLLHVADLGPVVSRPEVHLVVGVAPEELGGHLREILSPNVLYALYQATAVEGDSASYRLEPAYYKQVMTAFRDAVQDLMMHAGNAPHDSFIGVRHMLLNLETIARSPGIKDLFGRFPQRPAVIIATGPSLDKNFHLLRELQDRAILISVDASLKFLLRNGIRPHFVTCLERVPETVPFFEDLDPDLCAETVQLAVPVVVPEVYSAYPGPKAMVYRTFAHFGWLENDKGTLCTGHSSANLAFKVAEALGCDPVILVGQDLAYADDGATHSTAAYWGRNLSSVAPDRAGAFPVRGNCREQVRTNPTWNAFRLAYERDVASFAGTVINATEGGAYIHGTRVLTLRETIDRWVGAPFPVSREIRDGLRTPSAAEAARYLARVRSHLIPSTVALLERTAGELDEIRGRIRAALGADASVDECAALVEEALRLGERFFRPGPLYNAAAHVIQPAFVQMLVEHYALPNRHRHVVEINRQRAALQVRFLGQTMTMLDKLRRLHLDPVHTLP
ncbi:MAG: hypothetical protein Kow0092_05010 [Deferrisomatales bacterium]